MPNLSSGLLALAAAALLMAVPVSAQPGPAPSAPPATPATEPPKTAAKETGLTEAAAKAAITKSVPGIEFGPAITTEDRRRVLGSIARARLPLIELMGDPEDLSQVSAQCPLSTPLGPAALETSPFAVAALDFAAPDWPQRKEWLEAALKAVAKSKGDHQALETRGRLRISFHAWQNLGMFRVTVETTDGAAKRGAQAARSGVPLPKSDAPAKSDTPAPVAKQTGPAPKVEPQADGTLLVEGKYKLKGKGTEAEPYKVTWDQLVSAQDDYVPKDGRKEIPGRIAMLDGQWVEMTGYIAFPLMVDEPDECLSMMNQWDGCCIGIPPTPYDAIEVRLKTAVTGNARMTTYGTVRGRFKIDPHLVGGWLVGLYAMDQATMTPQTYGGFAP